MAKGEVIDSRVSLKQCKLAIETLHTHETKKEKKLQETELLPGKEQNVWLNVTVKKIPPGHKFKPVKIPIAHPLVDPRTSSICLITKDPQREYKDLLEAHGIKFISRVVGIEKLKGKFKQFEARRLLLKENGLFLADERIVPLLPKLLGVKWFEAKKQPIPVCLKRKDLKGELERAISSTYMNQNQGTCTSVKIGTLSQKPAQILANIKLALPSVAKNIYGGWDNIQAFHIKTNSSVSLPIWSCSMDESEGGRWNGLTAVTDNEDDESDDDSIGETIEADLVKMKQESKGKKRMQEDEEVEKPKKKAKSAEGSKIPEPSTTISTSDGRSKAPTGTPKPPASVPLDTPPPTKKQARKRTTTDVQPPTSNIATRPTSGPTKKEKRKNTNGASESAGAIAVQDKKKVFDASADETSAHTTLSPIKDEQKGKKGKKTIKSTAAETSGPKPPLTKGDKNKKQATTEAPETMINPTTASSPKAGKKMKEKKLVEHTATEAPEPTAIPLTKDELKQKRNAGAGERKKNKVKSSIGVKSAKDGILGKKIAQ